MLAITTQDLINLKQMGMPLGLVRLNAMPTHDLSLQNLPTYYDSTGMYSHGPNGQVAVDNTGVWAKRGNA